MPVKMQQMINQVSADEFAPSLEFESPSLSFDDGVGDGVDVDGVGEVEGEVVGEFTAADELLKLLADDELSASAGGKAATPTTIVMIKHTQKSPPAMATMPPCSLASPAIIPQQQMPVKMQQIMNQVSADAFAPSLEFESPSLPFDELYWSEDSNADVALAAGLLDLPDSA
jgi:hypothetical protein